MPLRRRGRGGAHGVQELCTRVLLAGLDRRRAHLQPGLRADACAGRNRRMRRAARCCTGSVERGECELRRSARSPHSKAGSRTPAHCVTTRARATRTSASTRALNGVWRTKALLVVRRAGDLDAAAAIARDATRYFEQHGDRAYVSTWAARLAELMYWSGAVRGGRRSVVVAREGAVAHDVYVQFLWRSTAAKLAAREGRAKEADRLSTEALRLAAASDSPLLLADLWVARAEVLQLGGQPAAAREAAEQARTLLREKGDEAGVAEVERLLSRRQTKSPSGLSV